MQVYILDAVAKMSITDAKDAESIVERVIPRLQHANSAVVLSAVKVGLQEHAQLGLADVNSLVSCLLRTLTTASSFQSLSTLQHILHSDNNGDTGWPSPRLLSLSSHLKTLLLYCIGASLRDFLCCKGRPRAPDVDGAFVHS